MTNTVNHSSTTSRPERLSSHAAVAELGQAALGGLKLQTVLERAVQIVCDALDLELSRILQVVDPESPLVIVAAHGYSDQVKPGVTTVGSPTASQVSFSLTTNSPVLVDQLTTDPRFTAESEVDAQAAASGMSVVISDDDGPYGILEVHSLEPRTFTDEEGDFLWSIANVVSGTIQNDRARGRIKAQAEAQRHRLRFQKALAGCAQTLLANTGENRLDEAVEALLTATQATYVFVERNQIDPELGLCSRTLAIVNDPTATVFMDHEGYWDLVPWDRMPTSRKALERGDPFVFTPEGLTGVEYDLYAEEPDPIKSELNIPIFVAGRWEGLIGFSEKNYVREWPPEDIALLTTAAAMIGAFWEREAARENREQLLRAKDEFLASVSHELRTPLTAVVGFGELLRESGGLLSKSERSEYLDLLIAQGSDVVNIVNDLLVAAKANIGTLDVTAVPVNLRAQTAQVVGSIEPGPSSRISFRETGDLRALGDPERIRQVIRNLLTNAIRYGGPSIEIRLAVDTAAHIRVCDNGPGIPLPDQKRIFAPYQRAHDAPGVAGSLGLGLSISRQLARLMGGDLTYHFDGEQSVFSLTLPVSPVA